MSHPSEALVRRFYDELSGGHLEGVTAVLDEHVRWHVPGRSPLAGDYRGPDEVGAYLAALEERSGGTFSIELHDVLANDEHVVALVILRAAREGRELAVMATHVWHLKDGRATEFWTASTDPYAVDDFWS